MSRSHRWVMPFVALALCLGVPVAAGAAPVPVVALTVDRAVLFSGETVTARARANANCSWLIVWAASKQVRTGRTASVAFTAPVVTRPTRIPLRARCFALEGTPTPSATSAPDQPGHGGASQKLVVTVPPSGADTVTVMVLPPGNGVVSPPGDRGVQPGGLPGTGGPARALLLAGLASLLGGVLAVRFARGSARKSTASSTDL